MDSPSSIEVPRPVGKEFYTPCYVARKQALHLEDNRGESRANGTRKETRELEETKLKRSVRALKIACHSK